MLVTAPILIRHSLSRATRSVAMPTQGTAGATKKAVHASVSTLYNPGLSSTSSMHPHLRAESLAVALCLRLAGEAKRRRENHSAGLNGCRASRRMNSCSEIRVLNGAGLAHGSCFNDCSLRVFRPLPRRRIHSVPDSTVLYVFGVAAFGTMVGDGYP